MAVSDRKNTSIRHILSNESYGRDSLLYQRLEQALYRLSADVLLDLGVLVTQKVIEGQRRTWEEQEERYSRPQFESSDGTLIPSKPDADEIAWDREHGLSQ